MGQDIRRQKDLVGHRIVAVMLHNTAFVEKTTGPSLLYLPAVDNTRPAIDNAELASESAAEGRQSRAAWLEKTKAKHGDLLEASA